MSTLTGKSIGIALFLAAALMAAMFAMGAFAPAGVSGHADPADNASVSFERLNLDTSPVGTDRAKDAYEWKLQEKATNVSFDRVRIDDIIMHPAEADDTDPATVDHEAYRVRVTSATFELVTANTGLSQQDANDASGDTRSGGADASKFSISATTGAITYNGSGEDYETFTDTPPTNTDEIDDREDDTAADAEAVDGQQLVRLLVRATAKGMLDHTDDDTDTGETTIDGEITATGYVYVYVTITDANDAPMIDDDLISGDIDENTPGMGTDDRGETIESEFIATVTASDQDHMAATDDKDEKDPLTYSLSGRGSEYFTVVLPNEGNSTSAEIHYAGPGLNAEDYTGDTLDLTLTVTDSNGAMDTAKVEITVNNSDTDEPPGAPEAPTVKPVEGAVRDSLTVSWNRPSMNPGPMISSYEVRYREDGETDDDWVTESPTTPIPDGERDTSANRMVTLMNLDAATKYEVQVRACNVDDCGEWSDSSALVAPGDEIPVDLTTIDVPGEVTALVVLAQSDTAVLVSWAAPSEAPAAGEEITGYTVKHWEVGMSQPEQGMDTTDTFLIISGLKPDTLYVVSVAAMNQKGTGDSSAETIRTDAQPPAEPVAPEPLVLGVELSSYKADTNVKATINLNTKATIRGGSDIDVNVGGFGIPDGGIAEDQVLIYSSGTSSRDGQVAFNGSPDSA